MFKFQTLEVWKKAIVFCDEILKEADKIPRKDQFSLGEQLRRAAISIPNNIAEGSGRETIRESRQFFNYSKGSTYEVINLLMICVKRKYLSRTEFRHYYQKTEEIAKMLSGLIKRKP